jgi:hypothetical protein
MLGKFTEAEEMTDPVNGIKVKRPEAVKRAQKKYYLKNKNKLVQDQLAYNKIYVRESYKCECGDILQKSGKYLHNRSKRHDTRMNLIKEDKSPDFDPSRERFECICGSTVLRKNINQHNKSKKHLAYIEVSDTLQRN